MGQRRLKPSYVIRHGGLLVNAPIPTQVTYLYKGTLDCALQVRLQILKKKKFSQSGILVCHGFYAFKKIV